MKTTYLVTNVFYNIDAHKKSLCATLSKVIKLPLINYANDFCYNHLFGRYT